MAFLNPLFLLGLISLPIPFIIHLWNRKRTRRMAFPYIKLLKRAEKGQRGFLRLKEILLLIMRTLLLLFLVLGFAKPVVKGGSEVLVILDDSFDMLTKQDHSKNAMYKTLFEIAKDRAKKIIANRKGTIILASGKPYSEEAQCTYECFYIPQDKLLRQWPKDIFIITKRGKLKAINPRIKVIEIGRADNNASIDSIFLEDALLVPNEPNRIVGVITNHTNREVNKLVRLELGHRKLETRLKIGPQSQKSVFFPIEGFHAGIYSGFMEIEADNLAIDNRRYFTLAIPERIKVLIVGENTFFVEKALAPGEVPSIMDVDVSSGWRDPHPYNVVILLDVPKLPSYALAQLKEFRGGLLISLGANCDANFYKRAFSIDFKKELKQGGFVSLKYIDRAHPIFSLFDEKALKRIKFSKYLVLRNAKENVLASFSNGKPAIVGKDARTILVSFPLTKEAGDFVLSPLFVPFMHRICVWLAQREVSPHNIFVNQPFVTRVESVKPFEVITPTGRSRIIPEIEKDGIFLRIYPDTPGIYKIRGLHTASYETEFSVNIDTNPKELELKEQAQKLYSRNLKTLFFTLALIFLIGEVFLRYGYNLRPIRSTG